MEVFPSLWRYACEGAASAQQYLLSIEMRLDTKISLAVGIVIGILCVTLFTFFPGEPIDYTGVGVELPSEMHRDEERTTPSRDPPGEENEVQFRGQRQSESSGLRRRRGQNLQGGKQEHLQRGAKVATSSGEGDPGGDLLDVDDAVTQKIVNQKAVKILGLTEDQVRQAVQEAKDEMAQAENWERGTAKEPPPQAHGAERGMDLSSSISLVLGAAALLALWIYLSNDPHGPLARFLIGVFPREMKVFGLY